MSTTPPTSEDPTRVAAATSEERPDASASAAAAEWLTKEPAGNRMLAPCVASLFLLVIMGTVGYRLIEGAGWLDGLYMTIITVATVGFGEVVELSPAGRAFTIVLILFGVAIFLWAIGTVMDIAVEQEFGGHQRRRRVRKQMRSMNNHFILCGFGRMGHAVARDFVRRGIPFVIVDPDPVVLPPEWDVPVVSGDAARDETLQAAGIDRARGLIATTGDDAQNVFIVLTARGLSSDLFIVARAELQEDEEKFRRAGADRVIPTHEISGRRIAAVASRPMVLDFLDSAVYDDEFEIALEEIEVPPACVLTGKTLRELRIREEIGITVLGKRQPDNTFLANPGPDTRLEAGDRLIVLGNPEQLSKMENMAGCSPEFPDQ